MYSIRSALADTLCIKEDSPIMKELFTRYVTPSELLNACPTELTSIKGVGPILAKRITSTLDLARALNTPNRNPYIIKSPKDVFELMKFKIGQLSHEEFHIVILNVKNHVLSTEKISQGILDSAVVHPRELYRTLLKRPASSYIAVHNHPSSEVLPSESDILLTKRLVDSSDVLGLPILDHIIVSMHSYYSLKENGLMN